MFQKDFIPFNTFKGVTDAYNINLSQNWVKCERSSLIERTIGWFPYSSVVLVLTKLNKQIEQKLILIQFFNIMLK